MKKLIEYKSLEFIKSRIEENSTFIITTHQNPDGDAIGSALGLHYFLKLIGKDSKVVNYNETPNYLRYLDVNNEIDVYDKSEHYDLFNKVDVIFILDLNNTKRLVDVGEAVRDSIKEKIVLDHHIEPENFADYYYVDTEIASTCEIVWNLLKLFPQDYNLNSAKAIYTGILTDTGSFGFDRTTEKTHLIASDLILHGVKPHEINEKIYNSSSISSLHLYGDALKSIELLYDEKLAIMSITQKMLSDAGLGEGELDGFSTAPLRIDSVKFAITIVELKEKGVFKLSFRAKNGNPIRDLASSFGGGGHQLASGARVRETTYEKLKSKLIQEAIKYII